MRATNLPGSIFIDIREYRDRTYGNTYYSAIVYVDGAHVFTTGMTYGYGDQAVHDVAKELRARGIVPAGDDRAPFTREMRESGVALYVARRDVRKRELPAPEPGDPAAR